MAKILIIDDDISIRQVLKIRLEKAGHEASEAADGEEGLSMARKNSPDLIFLDVVMPGIDGWEVCRRLKDDAQTKTVPIVMLTAAQQDIEKLRGGSEAVLPDAYFPKPWEPAELKELMDKLLKMKKVHGVERA